MRRIIEIEQPLHSLPAPAFAVVLEQKRDGDKGEHLQNRVQLVDRKEVDHRIDGCPEYDVDRLLFEVASVLVKEERRHHRDRRPVGRQREDTRAEDDDIFPDGGDQDCPGLFAGSR